MSSTYSTSLRIQLIATGTENEAWGTPTDNNFGTIIEQAITGVNAISLTGLSTLTLSAANAAVDQSRNAVLVFTGTPSANCNVVAPSVNKVYIVSNQTTGGYNVNMKTASGGILAIPAGSRQLIFCNGTTFTSVVNPSAINGNLTVTGSTYVGGNVTAGTNVVLGTNITGNTSNLTLVSASNIVSFQQSTGALKIPYGTTGQRPSNTALGMQRWNSDLGVVEVWNGSAWVSITNPSQLIYLIVAGGGGGGSADNIVGGQGGGGGAGGLLTGNLPFQSGQTYSIVVGAGGSGRDTGDRNPGGNGANSSALGLISIGGGGGGSTYNGQASAGQNGGSGGGGGNGTAGGSGTLGQGYSGENNQGGGGGAAASGSGANGGDGISSSINGSATYYAGGGGGGNRGNGGLGGGGLGGDPDYQRQTAGTPNTGGGGGAAGANGNAGPGKGGGSGIVIISYSSATQAATGGNVTSYTSSGFTYWVHTFKTSGTFAT